MRWKGGGTPVSNDWGMGSFITGLIVVAVISVPLAIWKAVEIVIWFCHHIAWR